MERNSQPLTPISRLAAGLLAMVMAWGFICLLGSPGKPDFLSVTIYHSIGLLTHDSSWAFDPRTGTKDNTFYWLAALAPVLSAITLADYFARDLIRPALIRLAARASLAMPGRTGVALIGLTDNSFALAISLGAAREERLVPMIFTDEAAGSLIARCHRHGIATYPRHADRSGAALHASSDGTLPVRKLNRAINRAQDLISFLPTPAAQVDFLAELAAWSPPGGRRAGRAWVLLEDRGLAQRLEGQSARFAADELTPRLLSIATLAARQVLMSQPFDALADAFGQARVHLAIYGMGALGRAIVKEAAQLYVTRPALSGVKLRISFFDADATAAESALLAEDPGLHNVVDINGQSMRIEAAGLLEAQVRHLPPDVTGHIITFGRAEDAFSLAVTLRRWLLEPPEGHNEGWRRAHHAAPIFVRAPSWHGLGRLFYKPSPGQPDTGGGGKAGAPSTLPDGIFGFGAIEGLFGSPELGKQHDRCLLDKQGERGAKAVHAAYTQARSDVGVSAPGHIRRAGEAEWHALSPQLRESNFRAYDHLAIKARAVGCRLVTNPHGLAASANLDESAMETLERLEHLRYLAERMSDGWRHAPRRLDAVCVHPDLIDWAELDFAEKRLDRAQIHALGEVARQAGQRFAEALVIGMIGHRPNRIGDAADWVRKAIEARLGELVADSGARAPLLLTALAPGADTLGAQAALALGIPFMAILPLPYEVYREDFATPRELKDFHRLAAAAELQVELPLRFGRASQMTTMRQPAPGENVHLRARQYALAGAYIVERAHVLIAVSDGMGSQGPGGTEDIIGWWNDKVEEDFATPSRFFVRPRGRGAPIVIDPAGAAVKIGGDVPSPQTPRHSFEGRLK